MMITDEDALICDLAETYQIYDYRRLPALQIAVFACGLRENSRIMLALADQPVPTDTWLSAQIADGINTLVWLRSKDAEDGKNRPASIVSALMGAEKKHDDELTFSSGDDFERARQKLMKGGDG